MKTLQELQEQLDYLEAMSLKRCDPETLKKIDGFILQVTFQIDELEQQHANKN